MLEHTELLVVLLKTGAALRSITLKIIDDKKAFLVSLTNEVEG
jgi:hypothetical protein